ncbi:molecular chaperone DnaJ [Cylindrospermopsis raciborskii LB2897]|jgi:hypothetical protein|uniref:CPP1-like family protein n=1 Tax=Cylindrospermopsis raciborskii TaxID=77022 RepID=UPI001454C278|nr:CPP1-like family protein [Cylindrospermopsis raciborskii]MBG0742494.1 CPP1-like family protein [Cylindrospermopsis raciborskii KL1]NLQ07843.1 molecular chaperone DnaJ [Cylindrospermopsis raciborskii LB2897]
MSDQSPYENLGVSKDASFDEIQNARNRLLEQYGSDNRIREIVEAAYDSILMERLRMRQEGKIKVPEGIRFPEMRMPSPQKQVVNPSGYSPSWLQRFWDQPSVPDILWPAGCYLGLISISLFVDYNTAQVLQLTLLAGLVLSIYFLNRKENKFLRAVLLTLVTLVVGLIMGGLIAGGIPLDSLSISPNQFSAVLTFILMWFVSSFLR